MAAICARRLAGLLGLLLSSALVAADQEPAPTLAPDEAKLLPKSLFNKAAVDEEALDRIDCHLRNVDFCYAGLLSSAAKALPENDVELETRCDELKAAASCMAIYNQRCQLFRVMSALMPVASIERLTEELAASDQVRGLKVPAPAESLLMGRPLNGSEAGADGHLEVVHLVRACEPASKNTSANRELRRRLFEVARCINPRVPLLKPCLDDLKTALQLFFESGRQLPVRPSCCAVSRFRHCAIGALDNACGLSSLDQLVASLSSLGGSSSMLVSVDRICRQGAHHESPYCQELLPPSGMKGPQRRGQRMSKVAKALDMLSFGPLDQVQ